MPRDLPLRRLLSGDAMTAHTNPPGEVIAFPLFPAPVHFERADTHAKLILSHAQELLLKVVAEAAGNSHGIDGKELAACIRAHLGDLASELSGAFGIAADEVAELDE